jgi:Zn-dependent protease/predicted transcriptional regulator
VFGGSFRVARINGIDIEIHPSWLLILAVLAWDLSEGVFPDEFEHWSRGAYWAIGIVSAVLLFATVLVHELAHAIVAKRKGIPVPKITLFIFGGVSSLGRQPEKAGDEFAIAIAGPLTSFGLAAVSAGLAVVGHYWSEKVEAIFSYLALVNVLLGIFNLLPGFPLDGGRVLRSLLWRRQRNFRRATRIAASIGEGMGYLLIAVGVTLAVYDSFTWLWYALIGWFLVAAAKGESQRMQLDSVLAKLRARDVMHTDFVSVPPGISLQEIVDHHMLGGGERAVMVADDRGVLGILTVRDVQRFPREEWGQVPAQRAMVPRERVVTVNADQPALEVLEKLAMQRLHQVPVLDEGRMVGMVTRRELLDRVQLAETLAPDAVPTDSPSA